jgi:hypothetical protein
MRSTLDRDPVRKTRPETFKASLNRWLFCILAPVKVHMNQPTKEQVREYMQQRQAAHCPPPSQKEINRMLGRDLIEQERKDQAGRR